MRPMTQIAASVLAASLGFGAFQAPSPSQAADDALARLVATPRYYRISASGDMKFLDGGSMCLGGDALRKMLESFRVLAKDPQVVAQLNKGCTQKSNRSGASRSMQRDCDKAAGAPFTSHTRVFGTIDEIHRHSEVTLEGLGIDGSDKNIIVDSVMTYVGPCPPNVKPGQALDPDGAIVNAPLFRPQ